MAEKPAVELSANPGREVAQHSTAPAATEDRSSNTQPEQPSNVAFTVTLKPADTAPKPAQAALPESSPDAAKPAADASVSPADPSSRPVTAAAGKQTDADPQDGRKPADNSAPAVDAAPAGHTAASLPGILEPPPIASAASIEHITPAEAPAPTAPAPIDPPVPAAAAHDIKLMAGEGDQRVEVSVTERGGDVFVAVRTPDSRLAGEMRQELPALETRLEQSGFHATTWQPAATGERERLADPQTGATGQDAQNQSRQNGREQQRDPQEQKPQGPENPDNPAQPKQKGKDFEWLLSSIQ